MKSQKQNYTIILVILAIIIVAVIALFSYSRTSQSSLGSQNRPYNPKQGYQGAGYYNISGQHMYISSAYQLNSITNTTPSTITTIVSNANKTTISSTIIAKTGNTTSISNTISTTASPTTSIYSKTNTTTTIVGGGSCVYGCGQQTYSLTQSKWVISNSIVDIGQYETLNSTVGGGKQVFTYNDVVYDNTGTMQANELTTGLSSSSNVFTFQVTDAFVTGLAMSNTVVEDSQTPVAKVSNSLTFTINPQMTAPALVASNSPSADSGEWETLTATWADGTSPYTLNFSVYNSVTNTIIANQLLVGDVATTNTFSFQVWAGNTITSNVSVTDGASTPVVINSVETNVITVNSLVSASSFTSSNAVANQLYYEALTGTWSGGTGPYTANFFVTNSVNGNVITNVTYSNISGTTNTFTFLIPRTNDALGTENINLQVADSAEANSITSLSNTITPVQAAAPITYTYNGLTTTGTSASITILPSSASSAYFCATSGYIGSLGHSWTNDVAPDVWSAIGHQTSSDVCSMSQSGTGTIALAGVNVANVVVYSTATGSSTSTPYTFSYNNIAEPDQTTFILLTEIQYPLTSASVSPSSGTCSAVENQETGQGYAYIIACSGQSANTYTVTVTPSGSFSDYSSAWAVYSVD